MWDKGKMWRLDHPFWLLLEAQWPFPEAGWWDDPHPGKQAMHLPPLQFLSRKPVGELQLLSFLPGSLPEPMSGMGYV